MPPIRVLIVSPNTKGIFCDIKSWIIIVAAHIKNIDANAGFPAFNAFCFTHSSYAATVFKVSFISLFMVWLNSYGENYHDTNRTGGSS